MSESIPVLQSDINSAKKDSPTSFVHSRVLKEVPGKEKEVYLPALVVSQNAPANKNLPPVLGESTQDGRFTLQPNDRYAINREELTKAINNETFETSGREGTVLFGTDTKFDTRVAARVMRYALDPEFSRTFQLNERTDTVQDYYTSARRLANLNHPHIVKVHDLTGVYDRNHLFTPILIMEKVEGPSLAEFSYTNGEQQKHLTPEQLIEALGQIGSALDYMHSRGIHYNDLKPRHIMLRNFDSNSTSPRAINAVLIDFGQATGQIGNDTREQPLVRGTTYAYSAPELDIIQTPSDQIDEYAFAKTALELLGEKAKFSDSSGQIRSSQSSAEFNLMPLSKYPPAVTEVFRKALSFESENRYASCMEFVSALDNALSSQSMKAEENDIPHQIAQSNIEEENRQLVTQQEKDTVSAEPSS